MRIAVIAITKNGNELARKLVRDLGGSHEVRRYALEKYAAEGDVPFEDLAGLTADLFLKYDALIYLCACGIAARMIAPHVVSKTTDPAVVVIDEQGKYAISLLSGHLGGANVLAREAAAVIGAEPVITTATDAGGSFSPDLYAQAHDLWITDLERAKEIAAASVAGERIGFYSEYPCEVPEGLIQCELRAEANRMSESEGNSAASCTADSERIMYGIFVGTHLERSPFLHTLVLQPRNLVIGIGCRRGIAPDVLEQFVEDIFAQNKLSPQRVCRITSIDRKGDEIAIIALAKKMKIPFVAYPAEKLQNVPGEFTHSDFVEQTVGVDNVCERSALAEGGRLILPKQTGAGMTMAVAENKELSTINLHKLIDDRS